MIIIMTEEEKLLAGKMYYPGDEKLCEQRAKAHKLCKKYNDLYEDETDERNKIVEELFPHRKANFYVQGPIFFDFGSHTFFGENFYANVNLVVLDDGPVTIGDNVFLGPNNSLLTAIHPLLFKERNPVLQPDGSMFGYEYAKPIKIGDNTWLAGNVTVLGGVTIGSGCVIGAGSVVTKDIPDDCFAAGNPCRVIRKITETDSVKLKKELM